MFCSHCGSEIVDDAVICIKCGRQVKTITKQGIVSDEKWSIDKFAGLIAATLLIPYIGGLIGLIFGIMSLGSPGKKKQGIILIYIAVGGFILSLTFWAMIFGFLSYY